MPLTMPAPRIRHGLIFALVGAAAAALATSYDELALLFASGDFSQARDVDVAQVEGGARGEASLWRLRLTTDAAEAASIATELADDTTLPLAIRVQAALDGATIAQAGGRSRTALQLLLPILDNGDPQTLPGAVYYWAGVAARGVGLQQRAREYFASVKPGDPAFVDARYQLGRIGLESGEDELALRYFESAGRDRVAIARPELDAGRWQALRLLGRDVEARELAESIISNAPASLAALEVQEIQRRETAELAAAADTTAVAFPSTTATATPEPSHAAVAAVQLAAFADRALAMQFLARWSAEIPGLHVDEEHDDSGQILYKVRAGSFVSRTQAQAEAQRIQRANGLQGFVVESGN